MMEKQPSNNSVLDQFINSQEQTYEEFLSTFTYLWKGAGKFQCRANINKNSLIVQLDPLGWTFVAWQNPLDVSGALRGYRDPVAGSRPESQNIYQGKLCGDEVQLFSLDEEFDYDSVALTPRFSEAEMKAIINLSEQKKVRLGLKSPGSED
ncbi:intraflagellar transport-associated protein [Trachemys scripta elegans]|uniref:intraflagellar transport-associated protein n=1 Tax=Trachemys scripta elegans TaxID=31138 RepID=UPI001551C65E|nr:intraflagellar transport-associated protein [Trachemys scripta elegans]